MGWFSSDEIVTTNQMGPSEEHHQTQAVALCILTVIAGAYVLIKLLLKLHKSHTERLAERAARRAAAHPI